MINILSKLNTHNLYVITTMTASMVQNIKLRRKKLMKKDIPGEIRISIVHICVTDYLSGSNNRLFEVIFNICSSYQTYQRRSDSLSISKRCQRTVTL